MKKILFHILMFSLMCSIQISTYGCENDSGGNNGNPIQHNGANQFPLSNDYKINARILGLDLGFGGISACADVIVIKDDQLIEDAIVIVNSDTIGYEFGSYQTTLLTADNYQLTIFHDGDTIASGNAKLPSNIPEITNLDSGDVHASGSDLLVEWTSVDSITAWQVISIKNNENDYESKLLTINTLNHIIPGENFTNGNEYNIQINAINGLHFGDDNAIEDPDVGYEINGPAGYFIGLNQSNPVTIYVNDNFN